MLELWLTSGKRSELETSLDGADAYDEQILTSKRAKCLPILFYWAKCPIMPIAYNGKEGESQKFQLSCGTVPPTGVFFLLLPVNKLRPLVALEQSS